MQTKKHKKQCEDGSALVITIIAVLILSSLAITGLTVSSTEVQSTQNFLMNKRAYYTALEGVEELRNEIYRNPAPEYVVTLNRTKDTTQEGGEANYTFYITGSMENLRNYIEYQTPPPNVDFFQGFSPPPLPAIGLGGTVTVSPVVWDVHVTATVSTGKKKSYAEIQTGVYSIVSTGY
jgi:hypothetical protein